MPQEMSNRVIIVGLFSDPGKSPVTQGYELARVLKANGYKVLTVSRYYNKLLRLIDIVWQLIAKKGQYDTAIVQFYSGNSFIWQYVAGHIVKLLGKNLVFTIHGGGVPARIKRFPKRYLSLLKNADKITCPSPYMADVLNRYMVPGIVIENIIPLSQYRFVPKESFRPTILWMRAFSDIYNPEMAIRAIEIVNQVYPGTKMYMAGPDLGSLPAAMILINELMVDDIIEIVGFADKEKKQQLAEICDIYISTNRIDNSPVTFTEMWALGLPVISTNVGGVPYMIQDGVNGMLVDNDDYKALAEKIITTIKDSEQSKRIVQQALMDVDKYDEKVVFKKWQSLLADL